MRKNFTLLSIVFTCLLFAPSLHGQGAEKVLVKSFNLEGNYAVKLDLPGIVEVREWENSYMRVEMRVSVSNISDGLLRTLIESGRYNIYGKPDAGIYKVFIPGLAKQVKVSGKEIEETFSFVVLRPSKVEVIDNLEEEGEPVSEVDIITSSL
jgi:hypothetical protein